MAYMQSNEGTKIPKAFKKAKAGKASGVARGKKMYIAEMKKQASKAKKSGYAS